MASAKAKKIQELREARGMSVDELSHRMGVDAATVRRWESGEEEAGAGMLRNSRTPLAFRKMRCGTRATPSITETASTDPA